MNFILLIEEKLTVRVLLTGLLFSLGIPLFAQSTINITCPDDVVVENCSFTLPDYLAEAVVNQTATQNLDPAKIAAGARHSLAIDDMGQLWSWGSNQFGRLGQATLNLNVTQSTPLQLDAATDWESVATGEQSSYAIKRDGTLWAWGDNSEGQLGLGDNTDRVVPVQVGTFTDWVEVADP